MSHQRPIEEDPTTTSQINKAQIQKLRAEMADKQRQMQEIRDLNPDPPTDAGKNKVRGVIDDLDRHYLERKTEADRLEQKDANATLDAIIFHPSLPRRRTHDEEDAELEEDERQQSALEDDIMSIVDRLEPGVSHEDLTVIVRKIQKSVRAGWIAAVVPRANESLVAAKYKGEEKGTEFEALTSLRDSLKGRL